ncbi:hypothetical protein COOONC_00843 [Cooperia oncophora]
MASHCRCDNFAWCFIAYFLFTLQIKYQFQLQVLYVLLFKFVKKGEYRLTLRRVQAEFAECIYGVTGFIRRNSHRRYFLGTFRFAAATLLITGQYAQMGLEQLPNRLNYCIDDLNLYKRDTDTRIRKLLIDDYQMFNRTMTSQLSNAGHEIVQRVKKLTGANTVDALMNISKNAEEIDQMMRDSRVQIDKIVDTYSKFKWNFCARSIGERNCFAKFIRGVIAQ